MKITIIFPGRSLETARATASVMPLAPCLLAALTPPEHEVSLVDMFFGDPVDYDSDVDVVAFSITSRSVLRWTSPRVCGATCCPGRVIGGRWRTRSLLQIGVRECILPTREQTTLDRSPPDRKRTSGRGDLSCVATALACLRRKAPTHMRSMSSSAGIVRNRDWHLTGPSFSGTGL